MAEVRILRNKLKLRKLPQDATSGTGTLTITTTSLVSGIENIPYNDDIVATGGTPVYIFTVSAGSLPTGMILTTSGFLGGTPTVPGTYNFTIQVQDAASATDTQSYTVIIDEEAVQSDLGGTNHTYYNTLIARPDMWKKNSMRTQAELAAIGGGDAYFCTYNPDADTDDHRQDGCRMWFPAFNYITFANSTVASPIGVSDTIINLTVVTSTYQQPREIKIDNEIVKVQSITTGSPGTCTVLRGQHGTTPATHATGTPIGLSGNSLAVAPDQPLDTGTDAHSYFFVWDMYWPDEWVNTGLTNHKALNFRANGIWFEPNTNFASSTPGFDVNTHVASWNNRCYGPSLSVGITNDQPITPSGDFIISPNKWVRWYYLLEMRPTVDSFTEASTATLASDITDPAATSCVIHTNTLPNTIPFFIKYSTFKIDNEIFITNVDNGTKALNTTIQCLRGGLGTAAATHTAGASVYFPMNCLATVWMADEDQLPVKMLDRVGMAVNRPGAQPQDLANVGTINIDLFQWELNTSTAEPRNRYDRDLNVYVRDWVVLRDPTPADYATPGSGLLLKPVSV